MAANESAAQAARDRGETRDDNAEYLRQMLPPGTTVYTVLRHVSRSGMDRVISCFVMGHDAQGRCVPRWVPSSRIAAVCRSFRDDDRKYDGNHVGGCGMDMGFHLVYTLSRARYGAGEEYGQSADDSGRVLAQRWL